MTTMKRRQDFHPDEVRSFATVREALECDPSAETFSFRARWTILELNRSVKDRQTEDAFHAMAGALLRQRQIALKRDMHFDPVFLREDKAPAIMDHNNRTGFFSAPPHGHQGTSTTTKTNATSSGILYSETSDPILDALQNRLYEPQPLPERRSRWNFPVGYQRNTRAYPFLACTVAASLPTQPWESLVQTTEDCLYECYKMMRLTARAGLILYGFDCLRNSRVNPPEGLTCPVLLEMLSDLR